LQCTRLQHHRVAEAPHAAAVRIRVPVRVIETALGLRVPGLAREAKC
jgi:hypothetical protein